MTFSFSHVIIAKETKECERKRKKGMNHMLFEDSNTEFKEVYVNDVKKKLLLLLIQKVERYILVYPMMEKLLVLISPMLL